ncbi:metalloendopeptidase OMA1, mitochondrial isoform X1 [Octopus sinensis]|uniref:Metalloendopeptidase OMA1, mitochondrial n=1 Tax=Octopus sinensis TaxID=2607531 RepID=A0A6P7TFZ8_9MOLL|nr:metalloendopeptidase OMA1, mitochondrial isoform X1 [Octopus sinensis]
MSVVKWCRLAHFFNRHLFRSPGKARNLNLPVSPLNVDLRSQHHHHHYQRHHHHQHHRCHYQQQQQLFIAPSRWQKYVLSTKAVPTPLRATVVPKQTAFAFSTGRHGSGVVGQFGPRMVTTSQQPSVRKLDVVHFHTSGPRYVPPVIWMFVKPVAKITALLGGRRLRLWWRSLPHQKKKQVQSEILSSWQKYLLAAGLGVMALITYYSAHLQETPITKRIRFIAFTDDQFMKIANFEAKLQQSSYQDLFLPASHPSYKRIIRILENLVRSNHNVFKMKDRKWKVAIISSVDSNAFVLPTGHVYVHEGLLNMVANDDQLAVILAHELAHVVLGHSAEKVSYAQIIDIFVIIVMAAIWTFLPFDGIALVTQAFYEKVVQILLDLPYSRKLETEADVVGLKLAAKACYDIREGSNFWKHMEINDKLNQVTSPQWLSTHPLHSQRSQLIDHLVPKAIEVRDQCGCPPLPSVDPREKFKKFEEAMENIIRSQQTGQNLQQIKVLQFLQ